MKRAPNKTVGETHKAAGRKKNKHSVCLAYLWAKIFTDNGQRAKNHKKGHKARKATCKIPQKSASSIIMYYAYLWVDSIAEMKNVRFSCFSCINVCFLSWVTNTYVVRLGMNLTITFWNKISLAWVFGWAIWSYYDLSYTSNRTFYFSYFSISCNLMHRKVTLNSKQINSAYSYSMFDEIFNGGTITAA